MNWLQKIAQTNAMSIQDVLTYLEQNDQLAYLKYVRCNGEYRFSDATAYYGISHFRLTSGDIPESAGFIKITSNGLYINGYSSTLNLGPDPADEQKLSSLLSMPIIERDL